MRKQCSVDGCEKIVHGLGLCSAHYERQRQPSRRGACRDCGGPKPAGLGRKICDECSDVAKARNRERQLAAARLRYLADPESKKARVRLQRETDPEGFKRQRAEAQARRRAANPEREREKARRAQVKNKYGLTLEEYDAILARGCAICGTQKGRVMGAQNGNVPPPPARLCMDHDHTTGKVRDALCHGCNVGLGAFADDPQRLRLAAEYLESHKT